MLKLPRAAVSVLAALLGLAPLAIAQKAYAAPGDTVLVSRATGVTGAKGDGPSPSPPIFSTVTPIDDIFPPRLSADGTHVAFRSDAKNLDPADTTDSIADAYVRDLQTNVTTLVSRATGVAGMKGDGTSAMSSLSADGRYVAFTSKAANLDPDDTDTDEDVYVRDVQMNVTTLVSRGPGLTGAKGIGLSYHGSLSDDGRYLAFSTAAANLAAGDTDTVVDVIVRDLQTGQNVLASRATGVSGTKGDGDSAYPSLSGDGHHVVFESIATTLHPDDTDTHRDIFVRDLQANQTVLVDRASGITGAKCTLTDEASAISADGRYVVFNPTSSADPDDTDMNIDVYRRDLQTNQTMLIDRASGAVGAKADAGVVSTAISADGDSIPFIALTTNLVPEDTDALIDSYVRQVSTGQTTLVSRASGPAGAKGDGNTFATTISGDGQLVAMFSDAINLDPADTDPDYDVYTRNLGGSTASGGDGGPGPSGGSGPPGSGGDGTGSGGGNAGSNDPNPNTNPGRHRSNDSDRFRASPTARAATTTCRARTGSCTVRTAGQDTLFVVNARDGKHNAVLFSRVNSGTRPNCPDYTERNRDWVRFGFTDTRRGATWHKTASLTTRHHLSKHQARLLARTMQVCFQAPYRFLPRHGYGLDHQTAGWTGVLPECDPAMALYAARHGVALACITKRSIIHTHHGWIFRIYFRIPANARDPKALG